eukprot:6970844-Alexandrium_andersonii.AAC.1
MPLEATCQLPDAWSFPSSFHAFLNAADLPRAAGKVKAKGPGGSSTPSGNRGQRISGDSRPPPAGARSS